MKTIIKYFVYSLLLSPIIGFSQNLKENLPSIAFEHLRINVANKETTANWYVENVGLEIIPSETNDVMYVADKDHNFMIEFSSIEGIRNTYSDIHLDAYHLAFEGHKTIEAVAEKMLVNGASQVGAIYKNKIGDFVLNLKDPNGFNSQLIHRVNAFYPKPVKSTIRFEHFAFNAADQKTAALWFVQFMELTIPWSKDIDTLQNSFRNYRVPYVGDTNKNMSFELYTKVLDSSLNYESHQVIHVAFTTDNPEELAKQMIYGGATQVGDIRTEKNGDVVVDLYDPRGLPIRLIKRSKHIL